MENEEKLEIVKRNPILYSTRELCEIMKSAFIDYQNAKTDKEKIECIMDCVFGSFVYQVKRYDYDNYLKVFCNKEVE